MTYLDWKGGSGILSAAVDQIVVLGNTVDHKNSGLHDEIKRLDGLRCSLCSSHDLWRLPNTSNDSRTYESRCCEDFEKLNASIDSIMKLTGPSRDEFETATGARDTIWNLGGDHR